MQEIAIKGERVILVDDADYNRAMQYAWSTKRCNKLAKTVRKWQATIRFASEIYHLGSYEEEEYAAMSYDKKAIELYGSDARVNFPHLTYDELSERLCQIEKENENIFHKNLSKRHQGRQFSNITKTSKYIGISRYRQRWWRAVISFQNKQYHLGSYKNETEAALAYDRKAIELYGDNARLNFPREASEKRES
ncbi:MAG: AP2/ERF family transcription factor [Oscillospiraceae bacterium]|jgi:hypothetical protein|nr:AP2/ERF family transcription factor [Oscillospiraceae bacterium]